MGSFLMVFAKHVGINNKFTLLDHVSMERYGWLMILKRDMLVFQVKGEDKDSHLILYAILPTHETQIDKLNALLFQPTPNIKAIIWKGSPST